MGHRMKNEVSILVNDILEDYGNGRAIDRIDTYNQPNKDILIDILEKLRRIVYPGYFRDKVYRIYNVKNNLSVIIEDVIFNLNKQIAIALRYREDAAEKSAEQTEAEAQELTLTFLRTIPKVREYVDTDLQASFDGDPAADSKEEIIFAYPGLYAITVYRLAHELYRLEIPLIPRIMTEYAHSVTGIDIHPGAVIGKYFFIDHGTGIVIGETTVIGEHVKIYQGVTLGALSTKGGQKLRKKRRHPTIEDNVTIYSGASILGGDTVIGRDVVIGGNAFITCSIAAGTRVTVKSQELQMKCDSKTVNTVELAQGESWN